jgi:hypothetical protein
VTYHATKIEEEQEKDERWESQARCAARSEAAG